MTSAELVRYRLSNHQLADPKFKKPEQVVSWLGAMQAQEYAMAKWAIGLRSKGVAEADVEKKFNDGRILRTHLLRPTWHFVTPDDIRWMLELTKPRVHAANAYMYRKLELDTKVFSATAKILEKLLQNKNFKTREELNKAFAKHKIIASGLRLGYIFMHAELEGLICSGPRQGKQFTYALVDDRAAKGETFTREQALAELTQRYFVSRGPATIKDFVTWSGLTVKDAKQGIGELGDKLEKFTADSTEYFYKPGVIKTSEIQSTFLMPDYDEYGMSYKDRSVLMPQTKAVQQKLRSSSEYSHWLVIDGQISGVWERKAKAKTIDVTATPFLKLSKEQARSVKNAVNRFVTFVGNDPPDD
jgi:hypothetical protein